MIIKAGAFKLLTVEQRMVLINAIANKKN